MSSVSWTATTSGSWTTASNWSGGALPGAGDDVTISVPSITVTLGSGDQAINSLTTSGSTLDVVGGTLAVASGTDLGGLLEQSAGLIDIASNSNTFSGGVTLTGGTLAASGNTRFNNTLQQSGGLAEFTGNSNVFTSGVTEAGGILDIGNGFFGSTVTESKGTINFLGNNNQLTGTVTQTGGTMAFQAGGQISNYLTQTAGTINVAAGTLALQNTASLAGTLSGAGTLLINNGQFSSSLNKGAVLSIGAIDLASGSLLLNTSESYKGLFAASTNSTIILGANTLTLSGKAVLGASVSGQGTIIASGGGALNGLVLDGPSVLNVTASINETGNIGIGNSGGSAAQLDIAKTGRLRLTGSDTIYSNSGAGTLSNAGTLVKTAGSAAGTATIIASMINAASATVAVNAGTIDFLGVNQSFSGTLTGGGTIEFGSNNYGNATSTSLSLGSLALSTAGVTLAGNDTLSLNDNLDYAGSWNQIGGTLLLGSNVTLSLSGIDAFDGGVIKSGTGTIAVGGPLTVGNGVDIEGFTEVNLSDVVHQSSSINLGVQNGSLPVATIEAGATWYIEDNSSIDGADGKINNIGTLEKLNGAGDSVLQGTLVNTGTLAIASATLSVNGVGTLGGLITGKGELDINGTYLLDPGTLTVGEMFIDGQNASVTLGANITFGNTWSQQAGTLTVVGETLTLTGDTSLDGGVVVGAGTITDSGTAVLGGNFSLAQSAVLDITGSAEQVGSITVGLDANSQAELVIAKGATYTMDDSVNILGSGTLVVSGTLVTGGSGAAQINPSIVDNGVITVSHGSMRFIGTITSNGAFVIDGGANLDIGSNAPVSNSVSFSGTGGSLFLENPQDFTATIGHFTAGDYIELAGVTLQAGGATLSANGETLTLSSTETLTFSSAQSLNTLLIGVGPHNDLAVFHT